MQISKSVDIFVFKYDQGFTSSQLSLFQICTFLINEMFICKYTEKIEFVQK